MNTISTNDHLDSEYNIAIGNYGELVGNVTIWRNDSKEPSWKRTLRWLKHTFDPRMRGAPSPGSQGEPPIDFKTSKDIIEIYEYYKNRLKEIKKREEEIKDQL